MRLTVCDKCGVVLSGFDLINLTTVKIGNSNVELCDGCVSLLREWIKENPITLEVVKEYGL